MEPDDVSDMVGEVFWIKMRAVDLKKNSSFIEQYIRLRNSYAELLLTLPVDMNGTKKWLKGKGIEIWGIVNGDVLLGVVILYIDRDNEIALFAKERNKGIGRKLFKVIESVAIAKKLKYVRGWVLESNITAQRTFEKNDFAKVGTSRREYKGLMHKGIDYKKILIKGSEDER